MKYFISASGSIHLTAINSHPTFFFLLIENKNKYRHVCVKNLNDKCCKKIKKKADKKSKPISRTNPRL